MLLGQTFEFSLKGKDTETMEQQATGRSGCSTAQSLGEGPENRKAAGNADSEGHADEGSDGKENRLGDWNRDHPCFLVAESLASLCPCPEACRKTELPRARPVHLAEEIAKHQSVQAAAWLLLMAYSQMREQRDRLKAKLAKMKAEQESQRSSHQESKSAEITRGQDEDYGIGRPWSRCRTEQCKGLKYKAVEAWLLTEPLRRKLNVSMKIASKLESPRIESEEVMPPGPEVMEPQREHEKTPVHED